jgi:hypothetical protein
MAKDHIGYEALADQALRSVVKEALKRVEKQGLIGAHHFYVTFKTRDPGVELPDFLLERYPEEMTIVLQNQFWGLKVGDDKFEVGLTFQKVPATLVIPFAALTAFVDPGVQFGLQFRGPTTAKKEAALRDTAKPPAVPAKPAAAKAPKEATTGKPSPENPTRPQVVSIDKFRKK